MLMLPSMLLSACADSGIPTPGDTVDDTGYDPEEFPRFHLFCLYQLCRPCRWGEHFDNAEVIANVPEAKLKTITLEELIALGFEYHD